MTTARHLSPGTARPGVPPADVMPQLNFPALLRPEPARVLDQASGRVVLVNAPAGSGKTVLLAEWIRRARRERPGTRPAWLTATELDGEAARLWAALRIALDVPGSVLRGEPTTEPAQLAAALRDRPEPVVLVLDEAHLITDPDALTGLDQFLGQLPPSATVIIAARTAPALRWHALELEGRLIRVGVRELAFTKAEVRDLCAQHDCVLSTAELDAVMDLTRGWPALVRMTAIYLAAHPHDRDTALTALARPAHVVSDYLAEELLTTLPDSVRRFLVHTSVPDRFTDDLAAHLTDRTARETLDELERLNFPMTRESDSGALWFEYHPMLRSYLRVEAHRLGAAALADLRLRTARWYLAAADPYAALPHLLAVANPAPLREFLRDHAMGLVLDGLGPELFAQLEAADAMAAADPFITLLRATSALTRDETAAAAAYLDLAADRPRCSHADRAGQVGDTIARGCSAFVADDWLCTLRLAVAIETAMRAGTTLGDPDFPLHITPTGNPDIDGYAAVQLAMARLACGKVAEGEKELRRALTLAEHNRHAHMALRSMSRLAIAAGVNGEIAAMRERGMRAMEIAVAHELLGTADVLEPLAICAVSAHLQGDERAVRHYAEELAAAEHRGAFGPGSHVHVVAELLAFDTASDKHTAAQALRHSMSRLMVRAHPPLTRGLLPPVIWALLRVPDTRPTRLLLAEARQQLGDSPVVLLCEAALARANGKARSARAILDPLLTGDRPLRATIAATAWALAASVDAELGNSLKAYDAMVNALRAAAPEHLIRPFLDVSSALDLLDTYAGRFGRDDAFAERIRHHPAARRAPAHTALTETELTVLKQLPSGRTTRQIADDLGVSINTIKTHMRGIYTKLGADSRVAALDQARRIGLL
ncbi:LuxR C-terminal-related transcriptional regulator [Nocardia yamanashiensis]|uniref:LuxR C-terminal-related transcriptional regulator n=1 Tax=Nocardia yamanashiensis TaxID=209247 RepID=UPI000B01AC77|nr:LuxR C-terminal-related transcriptional regulator [Nocardia yamanashiensis]